MQRELTESSPTERTEYTENYDMGHYSLMRINIKSGNAEYSALPLFMCSY